MPFQWKVLFVSIATSIGENKRMYPNLVLTQIQATQHELNMKEQSITASIFDLEGVVSSMPSNHHLEWPHEMQFIMLMLSFVQICLPLWLQESPPTMMVILSSILHLEIKHVGCKHHVSTSLYKQKYSEKQDGTGRVWSWCLQLSLSSTTVFARWWRIKTSNNKETVYQLTKWLAQKWAVAPLTPFLTSICLSYQIFMHINQDQENQTMPFWSLCCFLQSAQFQDNLPFTLED